MGFLSSLINLRRLPQIERKLDALERKLDALLEHQGVGVPPLPIVSEEVQSIARDPARKIEAIKLHQDQTGRGLAEAKHEVEEFIRTIQ
jgi:ribosomal protein L7/L12